MALAGTLCVALNAVVGFTNRSLRAQVSQLLGAPFSSAQMTYDLRRLRLKGLVVRVPRSHTYMLTPDGVRFALFYTKCYGRLLRPLVAGDRPPAPIELRQALRVIDHAVEDYAARAHLERAA
jgi:predicted MarR family transcription regulator